MNEEFAINRIKEILAAESGLHFEDFRESILVRRLRERVKSLRMSGLSEYALTLDRGRAEAARAEIDELVSSLIVNETYFFRDPAHYFFLQNHVLPGLENNDSIEILSAGCSTGEEPYTIAMAVCEAWGSIQDRNVGITAVDIDKKNLAQCLKASYVAGGRKLKQTPEQLLEKYFVQTNGCLHIRDDIKNSVKFNCLNIIDAPILGCYDIIFCKNVLMYFSKATQRKTIEKLCFSLKAGGYLFTGITEIMETMPAGMEKIVSNGATIYRKKRYGLAAQPVAASVSETYITAAAMNTATDRHEDPEVLKVALTGMIDQGGEAGAYDAALEQLERVFETAHGNIFIDFTGVEFVERSFIVNTIKLADIMSERGKNVCLILPEGGVKNMVRRVAPRDAVRQFTCEKDAMMSFAMKERV